MPVRIKLDPKHWTYGVEHELADWDTRDGRDWREENCITLDPEPNIGNSNGIAADGSRKSYPFGAEINTPPTGTPEGQASIFENFIKRYPRSAMTYRTGMHVHIHVPGLYTSLNTLKKLQRYITSNASVYELVDVMPEPTAKEYPDEEERKAARRRWSWMKMSHWTKIPESRVEKQESAKNTTEFFEAEVPTSREGKALWHAQPRAAISLRQLKQTNTIEFRHFQQTLEPDEVLNAIRWCREYLIAAFDNHSAVKLFKSEFADVSFPIVPRFYGWKEVRWKATTVSKVTRAVVESNIGRILEGRFDEEGYEMYPWLVP